LLTLGNFQQTGVLTDKTRPGLGVELVWDDIAQFSVFLHAVKIFALHDGWNRHKPQLNL
jgi:hypothetical protein